MDMQFNLSFGSGARAVAAPAVAPSITSQPNDGDDGQRHVHDYGAVA